MNTDREKARKLVMEIAKLSEQYNLPIFAVTEGASITRNNGSAAVRNARLAQIEWEKANGEDPDEDWMPKKAYDTDLYKRMTDKYKHIPITIDPKHTSSGTAYLRGTPRVVLRDQDPLVLAHELGHVDNQGTATQAVIDLLGWTANTTGWNWLMGKATEYKERYANHRGLEILRDLNADNKYIDGVSKAYDSYIDDIRNRKYYWTHDKPPEGRE